MLGCARFFAQYRVVRRFGATVHVAIELELDLTSPGAPLCMTTSRPVPVGILELKGNHRDSVGGETSHGSLTLLVRVDDSAARWTLLPAILAPNVLGPT